MRQELASRPTWRQSRTAMIYTLTKQPEKPQGNEPDDGQPMRPQTLKEWAQEMKSKGAVKFRLVLPAKKLQ